MSRFTIIKTAADHGLSEIFARNLRIDDENARSGSFQDDRSKVQTAVQVSHTGINRGYYQKNTQLQEVNDPLSAVDIDMTIQHVIPTKPHAILRRPKARPRIRPSSPLPRHGAIHQQRHKQYHRRYPKSEKLLRCHYAPWAPATTMTSGLCALRQHLPNPPPPPPPPRRRRRRRFTNSMTPLGLGERRRVDWSSMNDNVASEAGDLDTILEEEADKNGEEEPQERGRFKRQRRRQ